ncbi:hypothetical protein P154DRAFT_570082 [Amniculicola lignicola CBS 123094]|uniref:Uncharacterized protein n=1 Tax=Amniculicola lignicola CBS 123094 TaxID=1392246 RepID=A0A6A5WYU5_9PLEO|nr:hypothetical protein P154DRAFT_570082 [Amniculicola lignicola CBS 123094]
MRDGRHDKICTSWSVREDGAHLVLDGGRLAVIRMVFTSLGTSFTGKVVRSPVPDSEDVAADTSGWSIIEGHGHATDSLITPDSFTAVPQFSGHRRLSTCRYLVSCDINTRYPASEDKNYSQLTCGVDAMTYARPQPPPMPSGGRADYDLERYRAPALGYMGTVFLKCFFNRAPGRWVVRSPHLQPQVWRAKREDSQRVSTGVPLLVVLCIRKWGLQSLFEVPESRAGDIGEPRA